MDLPLRRNPVLIHLVHAGDVEGNEPHGGGVQVGDAAGHRLQPPALRVVDVASAPEDDGGDDPGPEDLPKDGRPPDSVSPYTQQLD